MYAYINVYPPDQNYASREYNNIDIFNFTSRAFPNYFPQGRHSNCCLFRCTIVQQLYYTIKIVVNHLSTSIEPN